MIHDSLIPKRPGQGFLQGAHVISLLAFCSSKILSVV